MSFSWYRMIQITCAVLIPGGLGLLLFASVYMRLRPVKSVQNDKIQWAGRSLGPPYLYAETARKIRTDSLEDVTSIEVV